MILHKEQVEQMDLDSVQIALKQFHKVYKVENEMTPEVWADVDNITNTLLYLEDREFYLKASANAIEANRSRWANK